MIRWRPFHYACQNGRLEIVEYLVGQGCDKEAQDMSGGNGISTATRFRRLEVLKYLVEQGCDIRRNDEKGMLPIHFACRYGFLEIVKYFLEIGLTGNEMKPTMYVA